MVKYFIKMRGFGKYKYPDPQKISEKKADELRSKNVKVYDSYDEAKEECK